MPDINNPHDKFFKSSMSNHRVAKAFMQQHLPTSILSVTDLSTLELQKESYVDERLSQKITDILYRAKIKDRDGYLYILTEHQSRPEPMMPFRLLDYTCQIMRHHVEDLDQHVLPVVVPLVFYNGSKKYSHSTDIFDLFGESELLARQLLFKPFHLIDLSQIPDDTLKENAWAGVLGFMQKKFSEGRGSFHPEHRLHSQLASARSLLLFSSSVFVIGGVFSVLGQEMRDMVKGFMNARIRKAA